MTSVRAKHLTAAAIMFVAGLFVFSFSIWSLVNGNLKANWFICLVFGIISGYVLLTSCSVIQAIWKRPVFESVFQIALPNSVTFPSPCAMQGGRAIIYFASSMVFYRGEIVLLLKQRGGLLELGKVLLNGTKPSFRVPVPTWFKWLNVQEAGETLDLWPRGTNRSFEPVIIPFTQAIKNGDTIELRINVENVIVNEGGKSNSITVCFKA